MKPAPFAYFAPHNLDEALDLLAQHGYDGKVLAGGQSVDVAAPLETIPLFLRDGAVLPIQ